MKLYNTDPTFHTSAKSMMTAVLAGCVILLGGCSGHSHDDHEGESHSDTEHSAGPVNDNHGHEHEEIILSSCQAKAAGVEIGEVQPGDFHEVIVTSGRVLPAAGSESTAVATQAGIVRLSRPWSEGMPVGAGTPLFSISDSKLPEGDLSSRTRIEYQKAQAEFERIEKLHAEKLATEQDYIAAKAALETARVAYNAVGAGKSGGTVVTAPKGGYVLSCLVKDGDYVDVGTPMMTVTSSRRLQLQADLPGRSYGSIGTITSANFRLGGPDDRIFSLAGLNGRVISHGSRTSEGSTFVPVIFEFDNAPGVVAGSYAEVWLIGSPRPGVISVPETALTEEQGVYCVYVQLDKEGYERRVVRIGARDGERVEIISGLRPGERIVTKGAVHVRLASASKSIPGHTHNH